MKISLISEITHFIKNLKVKFSNPTLTLGINIRISNTKFGSHVYLGANVEVYNSFIDTCSYIGSNSLINHLNLGKFSSISSNVKIGLGKHPSTKFVSTSPYFYAPKDFKNFSFVNENYFIEHKKTTIGNDVWIGANVVLMDGVTIGDGAIIAAGAIVTKDVEPYAIVAGVPAKKIKQRFNDDEISLLLTFQWWNKDLAWLKENFKLFHNIEYFKNEFHRKNN